jgi:TetR/AcrR family transcriptional repressor of nem operon
VSSIIESKRLLSLDDRSTIILMREANTREVLIQQGLKAFLAYGYDGVGIGPVLSAVGVPTGSFYHFFRSKEDFAIAVLDAYAARYASFRETLSTDDRRPPLQRLRSHFAALEKQLTAEYPEGGCLYGVLSQTMATLGPVLRKRLHESFQNWEKSIIVVLQQAQDRGDLDPEVNVKSAAASLIDAYEGALIRMKSDGVAATFDRFKTFALEPILGPKGQTKPLVDEVRRPSLHRQKFRSGTNANKKLPKQRSSTRS